MAEHPHIASLAVEMCSNGDALESREPLYLPGYDSPSDSPVEAVVRSSYLFLGESGFSRFRTAVEKAAKTRSTVEVRVEFAGDIEDLDLERRGKMPVRPGATHAVIYTSTFDTEYRIVRRCGDLFYKFFSSCEEAWREGAIHRHMFETCPDKVVPFVGLKATPNIMDQVPNFSFSEDEFPFCIITKCPPEPFVFLNDITDFQEAKHAVAKVRDLLDVLYEAYGFVHGDIHGKNVILTMDESVVLLDFGMSEIHEETLSKELNKKYATDVTYNNFSDEDVFLHVINDCYISEQRVSRAEYMHLYDIGRAIHRGAPRFEDRMVRHFLPDAKDDPVAKRVKASDFTNHFNVAHKMVNIKYDNLASKRLRVLTDKTNTWRQNTITQ